MLSATARRASLLAAQGFVRKVAAPSPVRGFVRSAGFGGALGFAIWSGAHSFTPCQRVALCEEEARSAPKKQTPEANKEFVIFRPLIVGSWWQFFCKLLGFFPISRWL